MHTADRIVLVHRAFAAVRISGMIQHVHAEECPSGLR